MVHEELLSFRVHFWPNQYPVEARYYEYRATGSFLILRKRLISTPEELRAFQEELTRREHLHEWSFLAYYEPHTLQDNERCSRELVTVADDRV